MVSHEMAERAFVQSMVEAADARNTAVIESLQTDVDRLRDTWAAGYAEQRRASEERIAAIQEDTRTWIAGLYADDDQGDGTANTLAQDGQPGASTAGQAPANGGAARPGQPDHAAELERARAIAQMPMDEYARRRAELGIRSATDMTRC